MSYQSHRINYYIYRSGSTEDQTIIQMACYMHRPCEILMLISLREILQEYITVGGSCFFHERDWSGTCEISAQYSTPLKYILNALIKESTWLLYFTLCYRMYRFAIKTYYERKTTLASLKDEYLKMKESIEAEKYSWTGQLYMLSPTKLAPWNLVKWDSSILLGDYKYLPVNPLTSYWRSKEGLAFYDRM